MDCVVWAVLAKQPPQIADKDDGVASASAVENRDPEFTSLFREQAIEVVEHRDIHGEASDRPFSQRSTSHRSTPPE